MLQELTELIFPERRAPRTCEACGSAFQCGASLRGCWCVSVKLSAEIRQQLRARYQDCLCPTCLQAAAAGHWPAEKDLKDNPEKQN